jgi:site-specific DNA-methyltransferase (adenine-specific)
VCLLLRGLLPILGVILIAFSRFRQYSTLSNFIFFKFFFMEHTLLSPLPPYLNQVLNLDCLEGMKMIPNQSVDMILCDLPYGVLDIKNSHTDWDTKLPFDKLWEQYSRVCKPNAVIVLTATLPFVKDILDFLPKGWKYEDLIWQKSRGSNFMNAKHRHVKQHEYVLVLYKKAHTYNPQKYQVEGDFSKRRDIKKKQLSKFSCFFNIRGAAAENYSYNNDGSRYPDTVLEFDSVLPFKSTWRVGMHPTEKPVDLFAYLVRTYTNEGDTVLDNCMGSGTTAVACILEKRNFIGFENKDSYHKMSQERILWAVEAQKTLCDCVGK